MRTVLACLWQGKDLPGYSADAYGPRDVANLARGLQRHVGGRLVIVADEVYAERCVGWASEGLEIEVVLMHDHGCGGWTPMLEMFRPDLRPSMGERYLAVGLDTIITGNCDWLFEWDENDVGLPFDPYSPDVPCDAAISYNAAGAALVWDAFIEARDRNKMADYLLAGSASEMLLLRALYAQHGWCFLEFAPSRLLSYKCHINRDVDYRNASMVYFHGKPKPFDLPVGHPLRVEWER